MALYKAYPKNGKTCKVTFELPMEATTNVKKVSVRDFNGWMRMSTKPSETRKDCFPSRSFLTRARNTSLGTLWTITAGRTIGPRINAPSSFGNCDIQWSSCNPC